MRARERGFTLLETLMATATLCVLALALGNFSLANRPGVVIASDVALPAVVARARTLAEASGDGATLAFAPNGLGFSATLYAHRPIPGSAFGAGRAERIETFRTYLGSSVAGSAAFALFISSSGSASWAAWSSSDGPLASEPACEGSLGIVLAPTAQAAAFAPPFIPPSPAPELRWFTLACADATLLQS